MAETLDRHGRIEVLINNGGPAASAQAIDTTLDDFRDMLDADLASVLFALTQLVGGSMIEAGRGSIINIASLGAERALDSYRLVAYNAAKAGGDAMTRNLAAEWGRLGVRVNAVGPAFFPTRSAQRGNDGMGGRDVASSPAAPLGDDFRTSARA